MSKTDPRKTRKPKPRQLDAGAIIRSIVKGCTEPPDFADIVAERFPDLWVKLSKAYIPVVVAPHQRRQLLSNDEYLALADKFNQASPELQEARLRLGQQNDLERQADTVAAFDLGFALGRAWGGR